MKITIDTDKKSLVLENNGKVKDLKLYSKEAFEIISDQWLKVGWDQRYSYAFTWLGRPIIQLPEDTIRIQEIIYRVKPDVIIETGVAHGGTAVFFASLCKLIGKGRVISVDIEIKPHNRKAIESHELSSLITLIERDSVSREADAKVESLIKPGETTLVVLDSNHTKAHVLKELELYSRFVNINSYIVATDGSLESLHDVSRGKPEWKTDNPKAAIEEFIKKNLKFIIEEPQFPFNEGNIDFRVTHWPSAFLKRIR